MSCRLGLVLHVEECVDAELVSLEELTSEPEGGGELEEESSKGVVIMVWALLFLAEGEDGLDAKDVRMKLMR